MKNLFISLLSLSFFILVLSNTKDPEFMEKFKVKHITPGFGAYPPYKNWVKLHYTGTFPETGNQFDSSYKSRRLFQFKLHSNKAIKCFDEVIPRMQVGEKTYFVCPAALAYGKDGVPGKIPPNQDLAFEVDLYDFREGTNDDL